jgi:ABC-type multidrug transport system fused ATPase/permease subunit
MNGETKRLFDLGAWGFAIVAGISLAQAALFATLLAALASFILAAFRIYDRIKYGPDGGDE